jgi:hypothetical protein
MGEYLEQQSKTLSKNDKTCQKPIIVKREGDI